MIGRGRQLGLWLVWVIICAGCGGGNQVLGPSPLPAPAATPPAAAQPTSPPGSRPPSGVAGTYRVAGPLNSFLSEYTSTSSLVLDTDGNFTLRFDTCCAGGYAGRYAAENGRLQFKFAADERWEAIGAVNDEMLEVRYNVIMSLSGFEDAVYRPVR